MARLIGPDFISLQVRDLAASRQFYSEQLGLVLAPHSPPDAVVFATEPTSFAIRAALVDLDAVAQLGHGVAMWFLVDDVVALRDQLQAQGVPIVRDLAESPFGTTCTFRDPDGYLITMHDRS